MTKPTSAGPMATAPQQHKRSRSAVLRSFVNPRPNNDDAALRAQPAPPMMMDASNFLSALSPGHPHAKAPLGELENHQPRRSSPRKPIQAHAEAPGDLKSLHKRNRSAISLKGITGKDNDKRTQKNDSEKMVKDSPTKTKSTTSFSALLSRPRSSKNAKKETVSPKKDKENQTPPSASYVDPPPIWAQYASPMTEHTKSTRIPLNDTWDVNDELDLYTPQEYSPSKGRNFHDYVPTLGKKPEAKPEAKPRPRSAIITPSGSGKSLTETFSRLRRTNTNSSSGSTKEAIKKESDRPSKGRLQKANAEAQVSGQKLEKQSSRVMAAVAAFNGKSQTAETRVEAPPKETLDPAAIEKAFEAVLESRNTALDVKEKMRGLDTNMKAEFIRQNKSSTNLASLDCQSSDISRPSSGKRSKTEDYALLGKGSSTPIDNITSTKKSRPRSLTFTLSKDKSLSKKKSERSISHARNKSAELPRSTSSKSLKPSADLGVLGFFGFGQKQAVPDDFITYLRKVQKPQMVEIGRLQKLRQLLRNETVAWADSFVTQGGMTEIVSLLYRIMDIEWREEHEDNLLHHTLNCLKALLTTSLALSHLSTLQSTLFPKLLALLFSSGDAKKGPAEFSTRTIIISLFFSFLQSSSTPSLPERATTLLGYLHDPAPAESALPVAFIADIHRPRPYKLWTGEISNVTKEVFWIFLHKVNIIPYPAPPPTMASYSEAHFPSPRAPVPAAPYVGGVEWEATTYLATHLDLLNGIIAALPTRQDRNQLRAELRDSGLEKVMGGSLRTCKEKFYGGVHTGLGTWVGAGREDGWDVKDVRQGPPREERRSPRKSPVKKGDVVPVLGEVRVEMGDLGMGMGMGKLEVRNGDVGGDWL